MSLAGGVVQRVARGGDVGVVTRVEFIQALGAGHFIMSIRVLPAVRAGGLLRFLGRVVLRKRGQGDLVTFVFSDSMEKWPYLLLLYCCAVESVTSDR